MFSGLSLTRKVEVKVKPQPSDVVLILCLNLRKLEMVCLQTFTLIVSSETLIKLVHIGIKTKSLLAQTH